MVITSADDEYFIALVNRFWTTWLICCLSANTWTGWAISGKECGRDTKGVDRRALPSIVLWGHINKTTKDIPGNSKKFSDISGSNAGRPLYFMA